MKIIKLPIDTKSLFFNILNDNNTGHTATVASPLNKTSGNAKLCDILLIKNKELVISNKNDLIDLLIKHSKSRVIIKNVFVFNNISVNGIRIYPDCSFGCYIKEEIDDTKVQFGRLKLHYPSKFIYEDEDVKINNRKVYEEISATLNNYAFIIKKFEYDFENDLFNFDALIVGENNIPYSKVFINEKGAGNKFNVIFNENADDYDREIIALRREYGDKVNTFNYLDYFKELKKRAIELIEKNAKIKVEYISNDYPYSLFDFYYEENGIKKYGILRVTTTKNKYFNISIIQKNFMADNKDISSVYLVYDIFDRAAIKKYSYEDLSDLSLSINSIKYEED